MGYYRFIEKYDVEQVSFVRNIRQVELVIYLTKRLPKLFFLAYLEEEKFKKKRKKKGNV